MSTAPAKARRTSDGRSSNRSSNGSANRSADRPGEPDNTTEAARSGDSSNSGEYEGGKQAPRNVMLADAATSSVGRWAPVPESVQWLAAIARLPSRPAQRVLGLGKE